MRRFRPIGLILLVALLLSPVLRGLVRDIIVVPVLYVFWIGRFIVEAIPQSGLWSCFLIVTLIILSIGIVGKRRTKRDPPPLKQAYKGHVDGWARLLRRAEQDDYYKWRLAQQLQKLTLQAIANNNGQSLKETRQQLRRGELDMPPEIEAYFQASLQSLGNLSRRKRFPGSKTAPSALDMDPVRIVQYLEELGADSIQRLDLEAK